MAAPEAKTSLPALGDRRVDGVLRLPNHSPAAVRENQGQSGVAAHSWHDTLLGLELVETASHPARSKRTVDSTHVQYLRGEYRDDKYELGKVSELIDEIGPVFVRSFDKTLKCWPYELMRGAIWEAKRLSQSTNAMILCALALLSGRLRGSVLVPAIASGKPSRASEFQQAIAEGWEGLLQAVEAERAKSKDVMTSSSSFGNNDPFTLTWLLELCRCDPPLVINPATRDDLHKEAKQRISSAFATPAIPILVWINEKNDVPEHAFPLVRVILLARALGETLPDATEVQKYLGGRLRLQLSASEVRDSNFDPAELVFALEGTLLLDSRGTEAPLLDRCFEVLADSQQRTPYWRASRPFISKPQGAAVLPLSVEVANSLLRSCDLLDTRDGRANRFTRHVGLFKRYADWLLSRLVRGKATNPHDKQEFEFAGWHSEHVDLPNRIHLWQTSQVLTFLLNYEVMLQRHVAFRVLSEVGLAVDYRPTRVRAEKEKEFGRDKPVATELWKGAEQKESLAGLDQASPYRVAARLRDGFVEPRDIGGSRPAAWSVMLYGPPGTGKTGIAEDLAGALGWPLVTVTPSDFIRRGEAEVEARAKDIFDALGELTEAVVLLDEIDRLILDRDSLDYRGQGDVFQLMTPSMLPKLKDLRSKQRVLMVVGTNYADRIDPAIKRPGRIDLQLLVCPPDWKQRISIIKFLLGRETKATWAKKQPAWLEITKHVTDDDIKDLARRLALTVFTELEQWVRAVVQGLPRDDKSVGKPTLLENLAKGLDKLPSRTVRLLAYGSRFRHSQKGGSDSAAEAKDERSPATQEPFDEFLLLLYLKLEAGLPLDDDERKLVRRVIGRLLDQSGFDQWEKGKPEALQAALAAEVKEPAVIDLIATKYSVR